MDKKTLGCYKYSYVDKLNFEYFWKYFKFVLSSNMVANQGLSVFLTHLRSAQIM